MYNRLKDELPRILEIVEQVPEPFKLRCFELLFSHLLQSTEEARPPTSAPIRQFIPSREPPAGGLLAIPAKIRAFLRRHNLDETQLQRVVMVENGEVHFIREPRGVPNAVGQIQWALLLALRNGIIAEAFEVDPEAVRSICIEKGLYDRANFAAIFRRPANAALFRGEMTSQGEPRPLSDEGEHELAELIRTLAGQT